MRDIFGGSSNLPPGCTQADIDYAFGGRDPSVLEENVLSLLEKAGIPQSYCDKICAIIAEAEAELHPEPDDDPEPELLLDDNDYQP